MNNMEHIKPGDRVLVKTRTFDSIAEVERVTKTQIIVRNGTRYRRTDGAKIGRDAWSVGYIDNLTEDDILRITYRRAVGRAERALSNRTIDHSAAVKPETYKALLLEAKEIIDAALNTEEEA